MIPLGKIVEYSASYLRWKNVSEGQTDCAGFGMGRKRSKKVEIYDFFTLTFEYDILLIRLEELVDVVDKFVIF